MKNKFVGIIFLLSFAITTFLLLWAVLPKTVLLTDEIVLNTKDSSNYYWQYNIEDPSIVMYKYLATNKNESNNLTELKYTFSGLKEGNTVIVFEYVNASTGSVDQKIQYRVNVDNNLNVTIKRLTF